MSSAWSTCSTRLASRCSRISAGTPTLGTDDDGTEEVEVEMAWEGEEKEEDNEGFQEEELGDLRFADDLSALLKATLPIPRPATATASTSTQSDPSELPKAEEEE
ncbi:Hypothetical predicted protein [Xyrichtys novacula]|uniref:Uncharacterized protein n=1 Tax=Xyrichtys novacula TaxID=13765 RepID=A0AAV1EIT0_XYRNO|nr:Hypothetical predicted protein [Xyrichtys novacula]